MNPWDYLIPENPLAKVIAGVLAGLFAAWLLLLAYRAVRMRRYRRQLAQLGSVDPLTDALRERITTKISDEERVDSALPNGGVADSIFDGFLDARGVSAGSPVARHVRSIFLAGWDESRLDSGELIRHTANNLFRGNGLLQSILATFIIIGLLGTLFGLAESLSQLSPLIQSESVSNKDLAKALSELLGQLKSAFAPSIWGVLFTAFGVLLFAAYLQLFASPTRNLLERLTLAVWVPKLFPTTSQRVLETLQLSERQMQRSFVAAQQVALFAESMQSDVGELRGNIDSANKTLVLLERSSSRINDFTDKFVGAVERLAPFQQELHALYEQMLSESRAFQDSVAARVKESEDFFQGTVGVLGNQNQQLGAVLAALNSYEAAYLEKRQQIDSAIEGVLQAARKTFEDIGDRNREVVEALATPLRTELLEGFGAVDSTLTAKLESIVQRFGAFDAPINDAARKIEGSLEAVVNRTERLTKELQWEFLKQNETNEKQLEQLGEFNQKIVTLLSELGQTSRSQDERAGALGDSIEKLVAQIAQLNQSLSAREGPGAPHDFAGGNGGPSSLESFMERLLSNSADQTRHVQNLAAEVKAIGSALGAMKRSGGGAQSFDRGRDDSGVGHSGNSVGFTLDTYPDGGGRLRRMGRWLRRFVSRG